MVRYSTGQEADDSARYATSLKLQAILDAVAQAAADWQGSGAAGTFAETHYPAGRWAEHKTGFRNAVRRNRTSAIDDVLAVLRRCREARSGTSIRVGPNSHRYEGTAARFADGAKSTEYVPRDGSIFGEAWLRQGVADAVGAAENLYVHPDDKAAYDTTDAAWAQRVRHQLADAAIQELQALKVGEIATWELPFE